MEEAKKYWAFISYSHKDKKWGDWLHKALETYRVPKKLVGTLGREGAVPKRVFPIFRDREELPTSAELGANINEALNQSRNLIVICSPNSSQSIWVNEEVKSFKALGGENRVLCLIVDGEPNATDKPNEDAPECFPEAIRYRVNEAGGITEERTEPIAADVRDGKDGKLNSKLKLLAGLIGVDFDALKQRDRRRRRLRTGAGIVGATLLLLAGLSGWFVLEQEKEQRIFQQTYFLMDLSREKTRSGRSTLGVRLAELALKKAGSLDLAKFTKGVESYLGVPLSDRAFVDWMIYPRAQALLTSAVLHHPEQSAVVNLESIPKSAILIPDHQRIVMQSADNSVRVLDATDGKELYVLVKPDEGLSYFASSHDGRRIVTVSGSGTESRIHVWDSRTGQRLATLRGHSGSVIHAGFSPDGRLLVTTSTDKSARVWDTESGEDLHLLEGHAGPVLHAAFSPDARHLATASEDNTVRIWNVEDGSSVRLLEGHTDSVSHVKFSPDGNRLVSASADATCRLWDLTSGSVDVVLAEKYSKKPISLATFNFDGGHVLTRTIDHVYQLWEANTGKRIGEFGVPKLAHAGFSPDGRRVVISYGNVLEVLDTASGEPLFVLAGHDGVVVHAAFSDDGQRVLTVSRDQTLRVWDLKVDYAPLTLTGHTDWVRQVSFSADGSRIVTASSDGSVRLWDADSGVKLVRLKANKYLMDVAISPDGNRVLARNSERVWVWDTSTGELLFNFAGRINFVDAAAFSADGTRIVIPPGDNTAEVRDANSGRVLHVLEGHLATVWSASFSRSGRYIVTSSSDKTARIWDAVNGEQLKILTGHDEGVTGAFFSPNDRQIVTTAGDQTARIWDATSGQMLAVLSGHVMEALRARFSPDGKYVATIDSPDFASYMDVTHTRIWDASSGKAGVVLPGHDGVTRVSFSSDGRRLLIVSDAARVWDVESGQVIAVFAVSGAALSPDGRRVATVSNDKVQVWRLPQVIAPLSDYVRRIAQRKLTEDELTMLLPILPPIFGH